MFAMVDATLGNLDFDDMLRYVEEEGQAKPKGFKRRPPRKLHLPNL